MEAWVKSVDDEEVDKYFLQGDEKCSVRRLVVSDADLRTAYINSEGPSLPQSLLTSSTLLSTDYSTSTFEIVYVLSEYSVTQVVHHMCSTLAVFTYSLTHHYRTVHLAAKYSTVPHSMCTRLF